MAEIERKLKGRRAERLVKKGRRGGGVVEWVTWGNYPRAVFFVGNLVPVWKKNNKAWGVGPEASKDRGHSVHCKRKSVARELLCEIGGVS